MHLRSDSFAQGTPIPGEFAFGVPDGRGRIAFGGNRNPHLVWSDAPAGTAGFAVICRDGDVPSQPDDVNVDGRTVPADLPRTDFFHWVLVDIPRDVTEIAAGTFGEGVVPRGKDGSGPFGRQGSNDYTGWFSGDTDMAGEYLGYDGPCPPWNDSIVHHYVFTVAALDVATLPVAERFDGPEARRAMAGHVLLEASLMGTYSLNPDVPA